MAEQGPTTPTPADPSPGPDAPQPQAPYAGVLSEIARRIAHDPFLFVIAIGVLLIGLTVMASGIGTPDLRFIVIVIAALAFVVIFGYYLQSALQMRSKSRPDAPPPEPVQDRPPPVGATRPDPAQGAAQTPPASTASQATGGTTVEQHPAVPVPSATSPGASSPAQVSPSELRHIITTYFNLGELHTLCFDLNVDYDSLPGAGKGDKARELVAYMERHGRSAELVSACRQLRPNAPWPGTV
jgi:hypothetical protein